MSTLDGYSDAVDTPVATTGRPQFQPLVAVDPVTGTVALSYEDTRYDPQRSRPVDSVQISGDGGSSFTPETYADAPQFAFDQATRRDLSLGPIPANQVAQPDVGQAAISGLGDHQGLAIFNGKLFSIFASNVDGGLKNGTTNDGKTHIHVAPMTYQAGPRVIASTEGQVVAQSVTGLDGNVIPFNSTSAADGTPQVDGLVVTFDRPVDVATFTPADVTVTYRDAFTPGTSTGIPQNVLSVTPLSDGTAGPGAAGTTKFLVRFGQRIADNSPQGFHILGPSGVGTYSYTVGPAIRDLARSTLATNFYYADQTVANLPSLPPVGTGGSGVATQDDARSTLTIAGVPPSQGIVDLKVLVTLDHTNDGDLVLKLISPLGRVITLANNQGQGGQGYLDTTFDEEADPFQGIGPPFSGHIRTAFFNPSALGGLHALDGQGPDGKWTLEVDDTRAGNVGKLVSWGLEVTTSTRSFDGNFTQAGTAAQTGDLMDQNGDGVGGRNPNVGVFPYGSEVFGTAPGDVYAVPTPDPVDPEVFDGQNVNPPYSPTSLPLMISGPRVVGSAVPGVTKTADNLVTDAAVPALDITFDRDMDPNTILVGNHVARVATPYGTFAPGDLLPDGSTFAVRIVQDPAVPGLRTYQVQFEEVPAGQAAPIPFPQTQSGTYSVTLTSDIQSKNGDQLDQNQNAGLDFLRGTASAGVLPVSYPSQAPVPIAGGTTVESDIAVPDGFLVKGVTVGLNITYPRDSALTASLVSPDGLSVLLFSGVGNVGNGANFQDTVLDDNAATPISNGGPPFFGTFNPQQPLSQFVNHFSAGTWRLVITSPAGSPSGTIVSWSLNLAQPLSNSGLGEPVADQATQGFRIFTLDPANPLAANTWTAVGPDGEGAKTPGGNAEVAGRIGAIAVDPSDPSGNTVFVSGASGGIWKTSDFLTKDPAGPTYVPLTDNATTFGLNVSSIAVFPRNNDPRQSIVFASTGDAQAAGDPAQRGGLSSRGIGFLRSEDGGATWTLLDSRNNTSLSGRDHYFASVPGQAGTTSYKVVVDPRLSPSGQVIVYAVLSDIDGAGALVASGAKGGIWKSIDTGQTWTQMRGGEATDLVLDLNSRNANSGNIDFLYAAFRGDGVYFSPNGAQNFNLLSGAVGDPLIQEVDTVQPRPVQVGPSQTPNGLSGKIVLAKPARRVNPDGSNADPLYNLVTQGWLYAAVVNYVAPDPVQSPLGSTIVGLFLTKDFGQTWTKVSVGADNTVFPDLPSNAKPADINIAGSATPQGQPFSLGDFDLSLAVDPNNANVAILGGTDEFRTTGIIRVDTTGIHDAHSFYADSNTVVSTALRTGNPDSAIILASPPFGPYQTVPASLDPLTQPFIDLIRDPNDPFNANATILVHNTTLFTNGGVHTRFTSFGASAAGGNDRVLSPDPYAAFDDPWSRPTRGVHQILPYVDPLTGQSRYLFATDQGVYTSVTDANGQVVGSIGGQATLDTNQGDQRIVVGSRNGDLAIAQEFQGSAQPSQLAAQLATLAGFFYANTQDVGLAQSDPNIVNKGSAGYGDLSYNVDAINGITQYQNLADNGQSVGGTVDRGTGVGVAVQQNFGGGSDNSGVVYQYRGSEDLIGVDGRPVTDTVEVNDVGRTFGLYQSSNPGANTPDPQFPFRGGFNLAVNPLSADQALVSSAAGRVFATTTQGRIWSEIGSPSALDGTVAQALVYGAPDPSPPGGGLGALNNYILAGTQGGKVFVTFTAGGGNGNQWINISGGLDGSPVEMIVTNPNRGSHEAYAVTQKGAYHIADTSAGASWTNITGNLFGVTDAQFNNPSLGGQAPLKTLTSIQADFRYLIPDNFASPAGPTHPMLYAGGQGGVFRSLDNGATWALFPDGAVNYDGSVNTNALLYSPAGNGGALPNAEVTDLGLDLGIVDPTTGRAAATTNGVAAPNLLMATTFGRGSYAIRLAPIVFPNTATDQQILHLDPNLPAPGGSDSGASAADNVTNVLTPVIDGLSEQSAFGNTVTVNLYDLTGLVTAEVNSVTAANPGAAPAQLNTLISAAVQARVNSLLAGTTTIASLIAGGRAALIGSGPTDSTGAFKVQVNAGVYNADGSTDGRKFVLAQAVNGSGTRGNFAPLGGLILQDFFGTQSFLLDTTKPVPTGTPGDPGVTPTPPPVFPGAPMLSHASDTGLSNSDDITDLSGGAGLRRGGLAAGGRPPRWCSWSATTTPTSWRRPPAWPAPGP